MRLFLAETLPGTQNDLGGVLDEKNRISKLFWRHTFFGGDTGNNPSKHDLETFYRFDWLITKFLYIFRLGIYDLIAHKNIGSNFFLFNCLKHFDLSKACFVDVNGNQYQLPSFLRPSYGPLVMWPWVHGQDLTALLPVSGTHRTSKKIRKVPLALFFFKIFFFIFLHLFSRLDHVNIHKFYH